MTEHFDPYRLQTTAFILTNAMLILPYRIIERGWLAITDGRIAEIGENNPPERGFDCEGDYIMPGLVELHTDHLESHYMPRPKVRWNPFGAVLAYDAQIASAGITTVFDSLRVGSDGDSAALGTELWTLAEALDQAASGGYLRAEHLTHLRCEMSAADVMEQAEGFIARFKAHLISLMDHTPGQRQFRNLDAWRTYYSRKGALTREELDQLMELRLEAHSFYAAKHRRETIELARRHKIVLASHDDTTQEHVAESIADGVAIAEFPTTLAAAEASHAAGIQVMMGAPNIVRGGSHSGNIAAEELARLNLLDILSSDYVPASMLMAAFELPRRVGAIGLPQAIRSVTKNPADAAGLYDRGAIADDLRADLVRVKMAGNVPVVRQVWREGRTIA
jgi:alpha-D-ribose 1-methylphosphonate 5-triphosphate diphosphatase